MGLGRRLAQRQILRGALFTEAGAAEMFPVDEVLVTWGTLDFCGRLPWFVIKA
jgi:hypothetical protein